MKQTAILLATLNARYHHASFGLRYLMSNLQDLRPMAQMLEFTIGKNPRDIVEEILSYRPRIVGLGIYIWNIQQSEEVVSLLKRLDPDLIVVLGGPEVSYETETQKIFQLADFVIRGEADLLFYEFCASYVKEGRLPLQKIVSGTLPDILKIASPYAFYTDEDIKHRVIYVEASRGCPYKCEFCLSSLDKSVRNFALSSFLADMDQLIKRGTRQFKFVDRTFNLSVSTSSQILQFFLDRIDLNLFLHFELVPDRLPIELRELIGKFPSGSLQFEIGIQTLNPQVSINVNRKLDLAKIQENFRFLTSETEVHLHADLIVGLPGESLESFAQGFDQVSDLEPHEIQVGLLKRLKGTPITRHDVTWKMIYQEHPPFQIIQTKTLPFTEVQKMVRFANFWDLLANSGNFQHTLQLLKKISQTRHPPSFFWEFFHFSEFLSLRHAQGHGISLVNLVQSAWVYLTGPLEVEVQQARECLIQDYTGLVKRDVPHFLRENNSRPTDKAIELKISSVPQRQQRHMSRLG